MTENDKNRDRDIFMKLSKQKKYLVELGYNVVYIGLYGSQNYGLDDENSDIDSRAIVIPKIEDIIRNKRISVKHTTEFGDIDVKDLLWYYNVIRKGSYSFIEPFQTKWYIGDKYLRELFGNFKVNINSVIGDINSKIAAFRKNFAGKTYEIEKWGYDPKQLHHVFRLLDILEMNKLNQTFIDYNEYPERKDFLIGIKRNKNNEVDRLLETVGLDISSEETMLSWTDKKIYELGYKMTAYTPYTPDDLEKEVTAYIKEQIKHDLFKSEISYVRQYRTFDQPIPKSDLAKFEKLKEHNGEDITYVVYEYLEVL